MDSFALNCPRLVKRIKAWLSFRLLSDHFVFSKAIFFVWGLVVAHSMAEYGAVCILMIYMTNVMNKDLLVAAIIISSLDGLSSCLNFIAVYVADNFTDRFNVIVFSTGSYIMGLVLLWISTFSLPEGPELFNVAVILIAFGKSGRTSVLKSSLEYHLRKRNNDTPETTGGSHQNKENQVRHIWTNIWWHGAWISGYIIALWLFRKVNNLDQLHISSLVVFKISALAMLAALVVFFFGFLTFDREYRTRTPFVEIVGALNASTSKKIHLWATFFPYSLVLVAGNSLFLAQVANMNTRIGGGFMVPFASFFVLKSFLSSIVVFLFWWKGKTGEGATAIRIGTGLVCSVFCCIAAWQVEIKRLDIMEMEGLVDDPLKMSSMNVLWLIPQYVMLGLMEGFGGGGLVAHIHNNLPDTMKSFTEPFCELVLCVGKFGSILVMSFCSFWFDGSINSSQLDGYFLMLAILCTVFYVFYLCWWRNYSVLVINNSMQADSEPAQAEAENDEGFSENLNGKVGGRPDTENIKDIAGMVKKVLDSIREDNDDDDDERKTKRLL